MRLPSFVALLGLLTALSLAWTMLDVAPAWVWPALQAAPVVNLVATLICVQFARRAVSRRPRQAGWIGVGLSVLLLLFNSLTLMAFYGLRQTLN